MYPEIQHLRATMDRIITRYPPGVLRIPNEQPVAGNGFFPGANGLYIKPFSPPPPMPVGAIMVLGHNYDVARNFDAFLRAGEENERSVDTWRNLLPLLRERGIRPEACFYTNFYMGMMVNTRPDGTPAKNTDPFPGARDPSFVRSCKEFFIEQLRTIRPRLVIVLGRKTPQHVSKTFRTSSLWSGAKTFADIDRDDGAVLPNVAIAGTDLSPTFIALTHPCLRQSNVWRRRYNGYEGDEAEHSMILHGLWRSGLVEDPAHITGGA